MKTATSISACWRLTRLVRCRLFFPTSGRHRLSQPCCQAQQTLSIPNRDRDRFRLVTQPPLGTTKILIVASTKPMVDALKGLQAIANECGFRDGPIPVTDPRDCNRESAS
ncbi:MAG: DUF4384 domain-containing protein [Leptolyngbyaceae cyanobacterium]